MVRFILTQHLFKNLMLYQMPYIGVSSQSTKLTTIFKKYFHRITVGVEL